MSVAAITITFNRLELTKRTVQKFYEKTSVDYHLFVDNGSTDGTVEWLENYERILVGQNVGIATAFCYGVYNLLDYDYILKLDNDVEPVTDDLIAKMVRFIELSGAHAVSPPDLMIDPAYYPTIFHRKVVNGYNVEYVSHTGGAFQLAPTKYVKMLCDEYTSLKNGDWKIGNYYRSIGCPPVYLKDFGMNHFGLNQSTPRNVYIF
jgi:glycosyltransferase involved in cell wall biosynthesis